MDEGDSHERPTAFLTGGGGDLGRAVAQRLARAGFAVAVLDLDEDRAAATLRTLPANGAGGPAGLALQADVTNAESFAAGVDRAERDLGPLQLLVNNAGFEGDVAPISDYSEDTFDKVMDVNVKGVFLGTKLALSRMLARGAGAVVNIASTSAIRGRAGLAGYVASKHAVLGLTRVAALDTAGTAVRVNAVLPGPIEGRMIRSLTEKAAGEIARSGQAAFAAPADVANSVAFLASEEARHINGEALVVDAGATVM